ncbi:putative 7 transmembrane receptor (rhodopsin family)-containing protein 2, partial [Homarus americanus]
MEEAMSTDLIITTTEANLLTLETTVTRGVIGFIVTFVGAIISVFAAAAILVDKKLRQKPPTAFMINLLLCISLFNAYTASRCVIRLFLEVSENLKIPSNILSYILAQVHKHSICAIAFNRVLAMTYPFIYKRLMQPRWVAVCLVLIWIYSALLWLSLYTGVYGTVKYDKQLMLLTLGSDTGNIIHMFLAIGFPLLFTATCYIIMYR